ncbi:hypothetical protein DOZ80_09080 [Pseudomonas fluorescens]|uniref:Fimbrial-type adhesion domain-containing protein n=1 Tax=Pseudomonas fluorescens TaxID=294 RepID=A0A327N5V4_PSEFL|nr:fimbrial protein [Pseudomonas fluorescens]RAI70640.1 hypothetical protein DOZ80_09080 [Pseudomonas fluorescens]
MKKFMLLSGLVAAISATTMVQAAEGELTFTGTLVASSCEVNVGGGGDINVPMGTVDFAALSEGSVGYVDAPIAFNVSCSDTGGLDTARLTFDPSGGSGTNPNDSRLLALNTGADEATGVGIALVKKDGNIIDLTSDPSVTELLSGDSADFGLRAGFVLDGTTQKPGAVNATLPVVLSLE